MNKKLAGGAHENVARNGPSGSKRWTLKWKSSLEELKDKEDDGKKALKGEMDRFSKDLHSDDKKVRESAASRLSDIAQQDRGERAAQALALVANALAMEIREGDDKCARFALWNLETALKRDNVDPKPAAPGLIKFLDKAARMHPEFEFECTLCLEMLETTVHKGRWAFGDEALTPAFSALRKLMAGEFSNECKIKALCVIRAGFENGVDVQPLVGDAARLLSHGNDKVAGTANGFLKALVEHNDNFDYSPLVPMFGEALEKGTDNAKKDALQWLEAAARKGCCVREYVPLMTKALLFPDREIRSYAASALWAAVNRTDAQTRRTITEAILELSSSAEFAAGAERNSDEFREAAAFAGSMMKDIKKKGVA